MGAVEREGKRKRRKQDLQKGILVALRASALLSVALLAPNAARLLKFDPADANARRGLRASISGLLRKGYISVETKAGRKFFRLTPEGERALALKLGKAEAPRRKRWDGQWRLVMFDIPESRRRV